MIPDDRLDDALRKYFRHQTPTDSEAARNPWAGQTSPAAQKANPGRRVLTLSLSVALLAGLYSLPNPQGPRVQSRGTPTTNLLNGATADGGKLPRSK